MGIPVSSEILVNTAALETATARKNVAIIKLNVFITIKPNFPYKSFAFDSANGRLISGLRYVNLTRHNCHIGAAADVSLVLRLGWLVLLQEWREEIDRHREKRRRVVLAGNLAHGLEEAQLQRNWFLAHHGGGLHHFFRGLKFALGIDDLSAALALGFGLLGHGALHGIGQRHVLDLYRRDFDAPRFGLPIDDLLQLQVDRLALGKQVIERGLSQHAA